MVEHNMSRIRHALRFQLSAVALLYASSAATAAHDTNAEKARALVSQMTLEEEIGLIRGDAEPTATYQGQAGYLPGVPRLDIPPMRFADGPPGILTKVPSSSPTATMGLAATFSREDARRHGIIIGDEANRLGINVALEPFVNIDRDITFSRAYNTYGEDPVLTGAISASLIEGLQSRGVMAQVKHYVGYDTDASDVTIGEQALHEVYLAPFDDAVKAGVSSVMCSYNRINGPYACDNRHLLVDVLRGEMGFTGFVTSDWGAIHDYGYLANGLDMEMGGRPPLTSPFKALTFLYFDLDPPVAPPKHDASTFATFADIMTRDMPEEPATKPFMGGATATNKYRNLNTALKDGVVTKPMIDRAATRVLTQMFRFGYFDGSRKQLIETPSGLDIADVIRETSEDAAVLLKNQDGILPLIPQTSGSIALIGPTALQVDSIGRSGERAVGLVERQVGPYEALRKTLPNADIRLAVGNDLTGHPVPAAALTQDGTKRGLVHSVGDSKEGIDPQIDFTKAKALPAGSNHSWEGTLTVPTTGRYIVAIQTLGARGRVEIDGARVAATSGVTGGLHGDIVQAGQDDVVPTTDELNNARGAVQLTAGTHKLRVRAIADVSGAPVQVRLNWVTPEEQAANYAAAIVLAKSVKTAVVFAWSRDKPPFHLPGDQDQFISAIADANPNTIVVLNTSQPVAMPWLDKVKGVVQMWWPGDEGGWATANVLAGRKNPAGRLPFTWAYRLEDYAANDPAHPERADHDGKATLSEGVDVGYRWFDRTGETPLYPFGFGLSYTKFAYSGLSVSSAKDGGYDVSFTLKNVGDSDGEEVPQVYGSPPRKPVKGVQFAVNALTGFDRLFLRAGQDKRVTIHLDRRRTQYWSVATKEWVDAAAGRTLSVGSSSRDLKLHAVLK
jgi:beta-glucosidase